MTIRDLWKRAGYDASLIGWIHKKSKSTKNLTNAYLVCDICIISNGLNQINSHMTNKNPIAKCAYRSRNNQSTIIVQFWQYKIGRNSPYIVFSFYTELDFDNDFKKLNISSKDITNKYTNHENKICYHELNINTQNIFGEALYINRIETVDRDLALDENNRIAPIWNLKKTYSGIPDTFNKRIVYYKYDWDEIDQDFLLPSDEKSENIHYPNPDSSEQLTNLLKSSKNLVLNGWKLEGQCFNWANLTNVEMANANLSGASFHRANLPKASLSGANLTGAKLTRADLTGADLSHADLSGADLSGADLREADLSHSNLNNVRMCGADLHGAILDNINLENADLRWVKLNSIKMSNAKLNGAKLKKASLIRAKISNSDLSNVSLDHADLTGAILELCNLSRSKVEGIIVSSTCLKGSKIDNLRGSNGDLESALRASEL
jgi:uncharacterized protein YjbI with pentapeptide repeats